MKLSETCKRLILFDLAVSLALFAAGSFFAADFAAFAKGMIFGTLFSILKFMLLEKTLVKAADMPKEDASNYARMHYMARYFLTGVVVFVGAVVPSVSLLGVVLALAAMYPAVLITGMFMPKDTKNDI